jgi:uncharacterized repeat protein (TIGR03837 family)
MRAADRWDIFCRVVDNFGDAGVAWRLSRQLAHEHGIRIRLVIDDLASLARLEPTVTLAERQTIDGIEVGRWPGSCSNVEPADVAIEAFGCGLPQAYTAAMSRSARPTLWIVLEYLSAEPWVRTHHGMPSPPPRLPLARYFFFPGFAEGTGGLLREADLLWRRQAFDAAARRSFWHSIGHIPPSEDALTVSLFAYGHAPVEELLQCWRDSAQAVVAAVPEGPLASRIWRYLHADSEADRVVQRGALEARIVPFLPQARYDDLLWACDVNFVRGEDSFVRAQWAARPLVWQAYAQEGDAHAAKLTAFVDLYGESLPPPAREALGVFMRIWNGVGIAAMPLDKAWSAFAARREVLDAHARTWQARIAEVGSLADNLASFCRDKLK